MSEHRVINMGTAEQPNYAGPAYAVGRIRGLHEALDALKNAEIHYGYEYDECVAAIEAPIREAQA